MNNFDPTRPDFKPYGLNCVDWKPEPMKRPDHHNEIELNLLRSGSVTYLLAGAQVRIEAGQLAAFWALIPHQVIGFEKETQYFVLTVPFAWFLQFNLPEAFTRTLLSGTLLNEDTGESLTSEIARFKRWEVELSQKRQEYQDIVLLEIEARLRRMAIQVAPGCEPEANAKSRIAKLHDGSLNRVEQLACFIAQHYLEPLTANSIGRAIGIHPNYAMSLFKRAFNMTLGNYLTHHRISHAQRLLVTTDLKILDVAMASGFNTLSRFNEAFRNTCDCSPREYRNQQKGD